jgi:CO/xanthine dehydrogenase Mo-binding subunit
MHGTRQRDVSPPFGDARGRVTGSSCYTFDLELPRMLHGKLLRSPHAHARIHSIDSRAALAIPGVACVVTGADTADLPDPIYGVGLRDQPVIVTDRVRYVGDVVAAVVAADEHTAFRAVQAIVVDYEPLSPVMTMAEALAPNAAELFDGPTAGNALGLGEGSSSTVDPAPNVPYEYTFGYGDVARCLDNAVHVFTDSFEISRINHFMLEPYVNVAHWAGARLEMWSCNQDPFVLRADLARIFGLPITGARVYTPPVGGGFGGKSYCKMEPLLALMARKARAPVRLALSMDEGLLTLVKHPASLSLTTGVDDAGHLLARRAEIMVDGGAYIDASVLVAIKMGYRIGGPYRWQAIASRTRVVRTNTVPSGSFRGFGGTQAAWACERQMDMIARRLGDDPIAFRRRNLLTSGEPFAPNERGIDSDLAAELDNLAAIMHSVPRGNARPISSDVSSPRFTSPRLRGEVDRSEARSGEGDSPRVECIEEAPHSTPLPASAGRGKPRIESAIGSARDSAGGNARGIGFAIGLKDAGGTGNHAQAMVRISQSGEVIVSAAAVDVGQGAPAALCRIATAELGLPLQAAFYASLDTDHSPPDNGTHVSCATTVTGLAVQAAARDARTQVLQFVAERFGCETADLALDGWSVRRGNRVYPLEPMIRRYYGGIGWEFIGRGSFKEPYDTRAPLGAKNISWMPCWSAAEVSVDHETGQVTVHRLVVGADAGRALDKAACHGQIEGAAAQAFGQAMFEELRYRGDRPDNAKPLAYRVPRADDMPIAFESFVAEHGLGVGPGGLKGIGEAGMLGIAAAIANAIEDASGACLTAMPFTPERVLAALDAHSAKQLGPSK